MLKCNKNSICVIHETQNVPYKFNLVKEICQRKFKQNKWGKEPDLPFIYQGF